MEEAEKAQRTMVWSIDGTCACRIDREALGTRKADTLNLRRDQSRAVAVYLYKRISA